MLLCLFMVLAVNFLVLGWGIVALVSDISLPGVGIDQCVKCGSEPYCFATDSCTGECYVVAYHKMF
jgi:hypothetical protein